MATQSSPTIVVAEDLFSRWKFESVLAKSPDESQDQPQQTHQQGTGAQPQQKG